MKKNSFKDNLTEIHKLAERMPKTLNEAINFGETDDMQEDYMPEEEEIAEPVEEPVEEPIEGEQIRNAGTELVDKIRKVSLQGMADLADTPELPEYEILKKIWQLCDKNLNGKTEKREE